MSIGTAIFLSSLLLGLVGLYAATKDRWSWRSLIKRLSLIAASVLLLFLLGGIGLYLWKTVPAPVSRQVQYSRINIGAAPDEVNYVKGTPTAVFGEMSNEPGWTGWRQVIQVDSIEKGKSIKDFSEWSWNEGRSRIDVYFDPAKTEVVAVQCFSSDRLGRCPPIEGILDGSSESDVLKRFGEPDESKITDTTKRISYRKLGVYFNLQQQMVYMLGINDPKWTYK